MRLPTPGASDNITPPYIEDDKFNQQSKCLTDLTDTSYILTPEQLPLEETDTNEYDTGKDNTEICPIDEGAIIREIRRSIIATGKEKIARLNTKLALWDELEARWRVVKRRKQNIAPESFRKNQLLMDHRRGTTIVLRNEKVRTAVVMEKILGRNSDLERLDEEEGLVDTWLEDSWVTRKDFDFWD